MRVRVSAAVLCCLAATGLAVGGALALGPAEQPVLTGSGNQTQPAHASAKGKQILVWSQAPAGDSARSTVYLRRGSAAAIKLNLRGSGFSGDVSPPWVVYQQVVKGKSDLKLYRMDTRKRVALPAAVNTTHWEWRPRISGNWLLFARQSVTSARQSLVLFNRRTKAKRVLATLGDDAYALGPGQIAGNWVTWYSCAPICDAFLYNIATRTKTKLEKPTGGGAPIHLWAPAVTAAGVVYVGQGPEGCGNASTLVRYGRAGDPPTGTLLVSFPSGTDFNGTYARAKADGSVDVLYARVACGTPQRFDVYRITDPPPP